MSKLLKFPRIVILQLLASFATVAAILFTPALPEVSKAFQLSASQNQWPITIYLFGFSFGPLLYGPLANRIGRKKALLFGLALAILGSLLAFFASSFLFFCVGRFIQALGAVSGLKIVFTMVSDLHEGRAAAKVLSILLLGFSVAPGLGLALGGWLTEAFGWKSCFSFLALYSALLFVGTFTLPETAKKMDASSLRLGRILSGYCQQFKCTPLLLFAALMGLSVTMNYIFATEAPYVGLNIMGLSPGQYGLFGPILSVGMLMGLWISYYIAGRVSPKIEIVSGIFACLAGAFLMTIFFIAHWFVGWSLFLPQALIQMGVGLIWVFAPAQSLSRVADKSNASAVTQFLSMGCATAVTLLVGAFLPKELFTMPIVFGALSLIMFVIWLSLLGRLKKD
ncbi:MAG TPA: MFS transporter [Rhabdochlamydiaceae bacterium]|nr:MFS transporter [Rhabdochlamydiaceae bacterium]